jgi:hypothetical protein
MSISNSRKMVLADEMVELMLENLSIDELFEDHDIMIHVKGNLKSECMQWLQSECNPEDIFDESELAGWASSNGWVQEE